ncbi:hypothetical protein H7F10_15755 [Acidithiobacillus sp. HP-6]|uniref:hypothetical protein n=1 Tax=unclassified Acidithiobacillus TaxID=2614800 RepID=UPI00187A3429|nr:MULTISPECIES: hypothetical protein [unclassified Acidithiobacillus]MBE7564348.1 hypothetical protein [Acidithiobacillus sp. HP-6]MBE7571050.1 hypothetical protein [Acidithiobacillus sp. HP-2]
MKLEIQAPELSLRELCEAAELFADYLDLHVRFDGNDTICCTAVSASLDECPDKPLVMVRTSRNKPDSSAVQALERILPFAPPGSRLAYDGRCHAIMISGA